MKVKWSTVRTKTFYLFAVVDKVWAEALKIYFSWFFVNGPYLIVMKCKIFQWFFQWGINKHVFLVSLEVTKFFERSYVDAVGGSNINRANSNIIGKRIKLPAYSIELKQPTVITKIHQTICSLRNGPVLITRFIFAYRIIYNLRNIRNTWSSHRLASKQQQSDKAEKQLFILHFHSRLTLYHVNYVFLRHYKCSVFFVNWKDAGSSGMKPRG